MKLPLALALMLSLLAGSARAQEGQGFAELRLSLFPGASGDKLQVVERLRPTFQTELRERVKLVATLEAGLAQGRRTEVELERALRRAGLGALVDEGRCCAPAHENGALRISRAGDYLDVDRLYLDVYAGLVDVRVGRQALQWGSAQFFNPTDPFPEVLLAEPWRPRRGVNAVRATLPFGERHDFSAVVAGNDALNELRAAGRVRFNVRETDVALIAAWRGRERGLVGVDLRGTLGVGWWVEAAFHPGEDAHSEVSVGVDYSFNVLERATAFAQYHRNGAGTPTPGAGALAALPLEGAGTRDPFAPFVRGRDYLLLGGTLGVLPELSLAATALQNLNDGSGFVVPTASYNVLDWLDVSVSAQVPYALWGRGGELKPRPEDLRLRPDLGPPLGEVTVDVSGLVPAATLTAWTRASF